MKIAIGVEKNDEKIPIKIYRNGTLIKEIDLSEYGDYISEIALDAEAEIMKLSKRNQANYSLQPGPPNSFIASTYARPVSFRISEDGDWDAIIFATASGYCFPYALLKGSVFEPIFNKENGSEQTFSAQLSKCLDNLEYSIFEDKNFPFLSINQYSEFEGNKFVFSAELEVFLDNNFEQPYTGDKFDEHGNYLAEYIVYTIRKAERCFRNDPLISDEKGLSDYCEDEFKEYVEEKIKYYIPRVRFEHDFWFTVNFGASCLLRIHNGEIISVIKRHCGGGRFVRSPYEWDETEGNYYVRHNFIIPSDYEENEWDFPIDSEFSVAGNGNKITAILDKNQVQIADLQESGLNIGEYLEVAYTLRSYYDHKDKQSEILAQELGKDIREFGNSYIELPAPQYRVSNKDGTKYESGAIDTYQNGVQLNAGQKTNEEIFKQHCKNLQDKEDYFLMDGFFDTESDDGFFRFNPAVSKLSNERYLFGVHDGKLFAKKNETWEKIGDKLKNFRLREMKNLNKAKREGI